MFDARRVQRLDGQTIREEAHEDSIDEDCVRPFFVQNEYVEVRRNGSGQYHPANITSCKGSGKYSVKFTDGDTLLTVGADLIRPVKSQLKGKAPSQSMFDVTRGAITADKAKLKKDMPVEANYRGAGTFYPGRISCCRLNGKYDVMYSDGRKETNISRELIREHTPGKQNAFGSSAAQRNDPTARTQNKANKAEGTHKRGSFFGGGRKQQPPSKRSAVPIGH
jgi:hypothetical protein